MQKLPILILLFIHCFTFICAMEKDKEKLENKLIQSIKEQNLETFSQLMSSDVDVQVAVDKFGTTPLDVAMKCWYYHDTLFKLMVKKAKDINSTRHGHSPLIKAILNLSEEAVNALIEAGADVNIGSQLKNYIGWTPLMATLQLEDTTIMEKLLRAGACVNAQDEKGKTALIYLAEESMRLDNLSEYSRKISLKQRLLCSFGAKIGIADKSGKKVLDYAMDARLKKVLSHELTRRRKVCSQKTLLFKELAKDKESYINLLPQNVMIRVTQYCEADI
jgi:ankyrin repeat protein